MFSVKPAAGVKMESLAKGDNVFIDTGKLLPKTRFTNPGKPAARGGGGRGGARGGGRGGGGARGGRGGRGRWELRWARVCRLKGGGGLWFHF
jgi:H/ACA ribonucleoprotein complex subunit 1